MTDDEWLDRVRRIRQFSRNGKRAPHKPLLLLYSVAKVQRCEPSEVSFVDYEPEMRNLLAEFGPPQDELRTHSPFHWLQCDKLWNVATEEGIPSKPARATLLRAKAVGQLNSKFEKRLGCSSSLLYDVAEELLIANWPESLHDAICEAVGLWLIRHEMEAARERARSVRATATPAKRRRDPQFRSDVLHAYLHRCAMCGWDAKLGDRPVGLEAVHVRWWAHGGPNATQNALCLCSIHQELFDRGALGITDDRRVVVSDQFAGSGDPVVAMVGSRRGRKLILPQRKEHQPKSDYLSWHRTHVFRDAVPA
ncbi:MAG TPA: restriction endonuclease [Acidimicrobiaceae bacterium]|nr:restriction endonuclease [Acidimicrobiaceae bacterium]HCB36695.1 restriction endonuclease [Acidimicrobiaceae bacterium]